ncbi:hypothetical protein L5515_003558 [Caenorhabditis briggsae]|uniref:SprT-like domain-containing protein n=1 Tax=Caenorhabditis briggsae TaxID=6238 RepID=A0AAE9EJM8_CAEBR|nr:hypothetical protein L5515_003558 [Caenorhabditis briggsae]
MPSPFRELHNNSNTSASSYETAWSSSFSNRKSINNDSSLGMKPIKDEPEIDLDESISNLENNISMMSVSSPISPGYRTPARKPAREAPMTPGERILQKVETNQEKELLKQLYPEMFQDASQPPPQRPKNIKKELKIEPMTDDEDANKENRPPWGAEKEVKKQRSRKIVISSDSEDEGEFDDYLKNLRKEPSKPLKAERKARTTQKKFVVEDDYISEEDSGGSSDASEEEEEEVSDEEFREFSPEVVVPKVKSKKKRPSDDEEWFLVSLTENYSGEIHNDAKVYVKDGALRLKKHRESLLTRLQDILLRRIFSAIPSDELVVTWNPRLRKSAGQCRNHRNGKSTVEMSSVVCTTAERVRDTFIHEMCHAAVWVVDKLHKEGHGPGWKRWGARCSSTFKSLPFIERCHDYEIEAKFYYVCENDTCTVEIKRQSKSLDTSRKACGRCLGRFILYRYCRKTNSRIRIEDPNRNKSVSATASKPTPSPPAVRRNFTKHPEGFREFSEKHYWDYSDAGLKHSEVIEILLKEFNERNNL